MMKAGVDTPSSPSTWDETGYNNEGIDVGIHTATPSGVDSSDFVDRGTTTSGGAHIGEGRYRVSHTFTNANTNNAAWLPPGATMVVTREYFLPSASTRFMIETFTVSVTGAEVKNVRIWIGTRDDWVSILHADGRSHGISRMWMLGMCPLRWHVCTMLVA